MTRRSAPRIRPALKRKNYHKAKGHGFTLIELLVVITIIAVIAGAVILMLNPGEANRQTRDSRRITDLNSVNQIISVALQETTLSGAAFYCNGGTTPCSGRSTDSGVNTRKLDGTGWVKINLTNQKTVTMAVLPEDPTNSSTYHYTFCSDGSNYEVNAVLESQKFINMMAKDGGDENAEGTTGRYELGSSLTLIRSGGTCTY